MKRLLKVGIAIALVLTSFSSTAYAEEKPDSPTYFRTSALGDLADMKKDIEDARAALEKGGKWKLLGNAAEMAFNIGQMKSLTPPAPYAKQWNSQLIALDTLHEKFTTSISAGTVTESRSLLTKMTSQVKAMETYVKKVK